MVSRDGRRGQPVARLIEPVGGLSHEGVEERVNVVKVVCRFCAIAWEDAYVTPSVEAIPEPKAWRAA